MTPRFLIRTLSPLCISALLLASVPSAARARDLEISLVGRYATGLGAASGETVAHHRRAKRIFVTNSANNSVDIVDFHHPASPVRLSRVDLSPYGAGPNSVAAHPKGKKFFAVAVEAEVHQDPGSVVFFDLDGRHLATLQVGALPDMITFTPDGKRLLVANEGEPSGDYLRDPEGSVSVIDLATLPMRPSSSDFARVSVRTVTLSGVPLRGQVRIYGPGATQAQDLEPEYIAVDPKGQSAWVSFQENNAIGLLDLTRGAEHFTSIVGLGFKDHSAAGAGLDPSDRDGGIHIGAWPVHGMYQPDGLAAYRARDGHLYVLSTNEGDSRDYDGYSEEARVKDLPLDARAFPDAATLQQSANLGRLKVTLANGDGDGDGYFEEIYAFGTRSFSVWSEDAQPVYDSGDAFEQAIAAQAPEFFNQDQATGTVDSRSDDKGPEPEGIAVGKVRGRTYAFIGFERTGGFAVYDITKPSEPQFVRPVVPDQSTFGPEVLVWISRTLENGTKYGQLLLADEVAGTVSVYEVH